MVRLIAKILRRDGDNLYLVTPKEKLRVQVDCVPFFIISMQKLQPKDQQTLYFETSLGEQVAIDSEVPLRLTHATSGESKPYLLIKDHLEGLILRPIFYQLIKHLHLYHFTDEGWYVLKSAERLHKLVSAKESTD